MRFQDFFKRPIKTWAEVDGEEINVTVLADLSSDQHGEWVEINDVINPAGASILDTMYHSEIQDMEDRLLAMAYSDHEARKEDAAAFAREMQHEALREGREQRGARG